MKHSERFALNEWLSDYPRDLAFDEVCDLLRDEDESVTVWQLVECYPVTEIIENIYNTRSHFECVVDSMKWGVDLAQLTEEETEAERATHAQKN